MRPNPEEPQWLVVCYSLEIRQELSGETFSLEGIRTKND